MTDAVNAAIEQYNELRKVLKLGKGYGRELTKGILKENPVFRLVLGTCPTLAVSTSAMSALGMGAAATVVLICSNLVISACRKILPDKVRIPAYITIIAGFVSVVQMLVKAFSYRQLTNPLVFIYL